MTVVLGGLTPHAPVLIPEIGKAETRQLEATVNAMRELARRVMAEEPDVVILATPHGMLTQNAFGLYGAEALLGDMARFAAPGVSFEVPGHPLLAAEVERIASDLGLATHRVDARRPVPLDYGAMVPLYYLQDAGYAGAVLPVTCSNLDANAHRRFGEAIAQSASMLGLRAVMLASGDLSHHLGAEASPNAPEGRAFDDAVLTFLQNGEWERLYGLDGQLREEASECAYRTLMVLLGALERSLPHANLLAYEHPFGVGFATVTVDVDDSAEQDVIFDPAGFAWQVAESFLQSEVLPPEPRSFPRAPQGCFVSLERGGQLLLSVGEVHPQEATLAAEIARQTLALLREYAGRHPLTITDLDRLRFVVDLVTSGGEVTDLAAHDPAAHGLLVDSGARRTAVAPGLDGVASGEAQLAIALRRLGLKPDDAYRLERFGVRRYRRAARPAW